MLRSAVSTSTGVDPASCSSPVQASEQQETHSGRTEADKVAVDSPRKTPVYLGCAPLDMRTQQASSRPTHNAK